MSETETVDNNKGRMEAFTFGDATPVLDSSDILSLTESWWNGEWYEPPISLSGLSKSFRANPHHSSAIFVKRNILVSSYIPHQLLSKEDFARFALDYLVLANGYLQRIDNVLGKPMKLKPALAKYMRRGRDGKFWWVPNLWDKQELQNVFQVQEPDINQEIYGVPEYLSAMQSAWLNESATLFRRKYYLNGSHAGFILYINDPAQEEGDIDAIRQALKDSKGPGNFRNLFLYSPNGKKEGIQVIPISEVQAKDEFFNIKTLTRDDVLAAHRVPPQLMGIVPTNTAGFGDAETAANVFATNEIEPLQERFMAINEWVGDEVIKFKPYSIKKADQQAKS